MYIWSRKKKKIVLFTLKTKFFANQFHQNVQILYKNWSLVPTNVHLIPKNGKICTFYTNNEVFSKKFHQNVQILDKNVHLVPKNKKKIVLFTLKMKFLQKKNH